MSEERLRQKEAELRAQARAAVERGCLEIAETQYSECQRIAEQLGDMDLVELARCNQAAMAVALGRGEKTLPFLRSVLVRNANDVNCYLAAYYLSYHYDHADQTKKALFYARVARSRAEVLERSNTAPELQPGVTSRELLGDAFLALSEVGPARQLFTEALALSPRASLQWGNVAIGLGYCLVLGGSLRSGLALLLRALRVLRPFGATRSLCQAHLDLAFAFLESRQVIRATRHAEAALELSRVCGWRVGEKNSLYMAGEAARLAGEETQAEGYFSTLQGAFFPDQPYICKFLMAVDVRGMLNLHAAGGA